jgi:hypothetical protein
MNEIARILGIAPPVTAWCFRHRRGKYAGGSTIYSSHDTYEPHECAAVSVGTGWWCRVRRTYSHDWELSWPGWLPMPAQVNTVDFDWELLEVDLPPELGIKAPLEG